MLLQSSYTILLTFQCLVPLIYDKAFALYPSMIHRPGGCLTNIPTVLQPIFESGAGASHSGTDEVLAITLD